MKRHRILGVDFDTRAKLIKMYQDKGELNEQDKSNLDNILNGLKLQFGDNYFDEKIKNLLDIGSKAFSVIAYHNKFLEQIRNAFVFGSYYPALTGSCALGERILNHLLINLRDDFKTTDEYKKVYRKESFDNWELAIETLSNWKMLLPKTTQKFMELKGKRNESIHFNIDTDSNERQQALDAIILIQDIINEQFTAFGDRPWFITNIPGEIYIKKSCEQHPFVKLIYLPNSLLLGYKHKIESMMPYKINDNFAYDNKEVSDEEFAEYRNGNSI